MNIYPSLFVKNLFARAHVHDLANADPVLVELDQLAFHRHRKLLDDGSIHKAALNVMKARPLKLVGNVVPRNVTNVITLRNRLRRRKAERKSARSLYIFCRLMLVRKTNHNLIRVVNSTPSRIHRVGIALFVISTNNKHRHRIKP